MPSKTKPTKGVPVDLDRTRHLRFPLSSLRALQEDDAKSLEGILCAGLKHEDPDLTPEKVGEIVSLDMLDGLTGPVKEATGGLVDLGVIFEHVDAVVNGQQAGAKKKKATGKGKKRTPS